MFTSDITPFPLDFAALDPERDLDLIAFVGTVADTLNQHPPEAAIARVRAGGLDPNTLAACKADIDAYMVSMFALASAWQVRAVPYAAVSADLCFALMDRSLMSDAYSAWLTRHGAHLLVDRPPRIIEPRARRVRGIAVPLAPIASTMQWLRLWHRLDDDLDDHDEALARLLVRLFTRRAS